MLHDNTLSRREALRRLGLLFGGLVSAPTVSAILSGCRASEGSAYSFRALDGGQQEMLATIADRILPATDTPGAREAGAHEFIDKLLADWMTDEDRDSFLAGLNELNGRAERDMGASFVDLDEAQQVEFLTTLDREAYAEEPAAAPAGRPNAVTEDAPPDSSDIAAMERATGGQGNMEQREREETGPATGRSEGEEEDQAEGRRPRQEIGGDANAAPPAEAAPARPAFFRTLKELTLAGYYTSEIGGTQELRWLQMAPEGYRADVPLAEVNNGRAWA